VQFLWNSFYRKRLPQQNGDMRKRDLHAFKGTLPRDFRLFCHESVSPKPLSIPIGPFRIFSKIRGDIHSSRCTTGVADTGGKWQKSQARLKLSQSDLCFPGPLSLSQSHPLSQRRTTLHEACYFIEYFGVPDPFHFVVDPDPDPWLKLMDPDPYSDGDADTEPSTFITDFQHPNEKIFVKKTFLFLKSRYILDVFRIE
jgi:hypothetical protein